MRDCGGDRGSRLGAPDPVPGQHAAPPVGTTQSDPPEEDGLTAMAVASRLGISERTVRRAIARGELAATKRAGVYRVSPRALADYLRTRDDEHRPIRNVPPAPPLKLLERTLAAPTQLPPPPHPLNPLIGRE